jgi:hypothetical protein
MTLPTGAAVDTTKPTDRSDKVRATTTITRISIRLTRRTIPDEGRRNGSFLSGTVQAVCVSNVLHQSSSER